MRLLAVSASLAFVLLFVGEHPNQGEALTGPGIVRVFAVTKFEVGEGNYLGARLYVSKTLKTDSGHIVGHAEQECTQLLDSVSGCLATFVLPRGKLMVQGTRHQRAYYVFAVVGGTGIYDNVRGTLEGTTLSLNPRRERLLFSLGT